MAKVDVTYPKDKDGTWVYGFPNPLAPPEEKAANEFGIKYARAIWQRHMNYLPTYTEQRNRWMINRKYAEGLQSVEKYKTQSEAGETSWMNLDFTPIAIAMKFVNNLVGVLTGNKYKIDCDVLNGVAKTSYDDYVNELHANRLLKPLHDQIAPRTGIPLLPSGAVVPEDDEEQDIYVQQNFKLDEAMAMQLAVQYVFNTNKFSKIERKLIRDLVVLKICAVRRYYDGNYNICLEYIDPVDLITPYSKHDDYSNCMFKAVNKKYTISEIAQKAKGTKDAFSEEELFDIAQRYEGSNYGNRTLGLGGMSYAGYYSNLGLMSGRAYDDFNINVLEFEFLGEDTLNFEKKTSKKLGNSYFNKKSANYVPQADAGEEHKYVKEGTSKTITNRYEGSWIVQSPYIYGYGKANNIPRKKEGDGYSTEAKLQIEIIAPQIYDMSNKSIIESIIPFVDTMQIIRLKVQQLLVKAIPPGLGIDVQAIENVLLGAGGKAMTPDQVIKMYTQTGSLAYRRITKEGKEMNGDPVKILPNGIPPGLDTLVQLYNLEVQNIYQVTGYNPSSIGAAANDQLVGVGEMQNQATDNTLAPLKDDYRELVETIAQETALMCQDKIQYGDGLEVFKNAIGTEAVSTIAALKGLPQCELGIRITYMPDKKEQDRLTRKIELALQEQLITLADSVRVEEQAKTDVKLAIQLLVYLEKKNEKQKAATAQANTQGNTQSQIQSAQAAEQAKQSTIQVESQSKAQLMQLEYSLKDKNDDAAHKRRMEELMLVNDAKINMSKVEHDNKLLHTAFDNATQPVQSTPAQ